MSTHTSFFLPLLICITFLLQLPTISTATIYALKLLISLEIRDLDQFARHSSGGISSGLPSDLSGLP